MGTLRRFLLVICVGGLTSLCLILVLATVGHGAADQSTSLYVDGSQGNDSGTCVDPQHPCETITFALTQAEDGDTIYVADGVYSESITLDKNVDLAGNGYKSTIIQATPGQRVLTITGSAETATQFRPTISGFTFMEGRADDFCGGGLKITNASPTIRENRIQDNFAPNGGGLCLHHSAETIVSGNIFVDNRAGGGGANIGGGLYVLSSDNVRLTQNILRRNQAENYGGGLYIRASQNVVADANLVSGNHSGLGGGLFVEKSSLQFDNNMVAQNTNAPHHADDGMGLVLRSGSTIAARHNTLVGHGEGIAVSSSGKSSASLTNTIIADFSVGISNTADSQAIVDGVLWHDNQRDTDGVVAIDHPVTGAPAFRDPAGDDYHITCQSAAHDSGVPSELRTDFDGENRLRDVASDLGADEVHCGTGSSPSLTLLAFQPWQTGQLFTVHLNNARPSTRYIITSYHDTDMAYSQESVSLVTDAAGMASGKVWSRCAVDGVKIGTVFVQVSGEGMQQMESNHLDCTSIRDVASFGSHLTTESTNDDWIYRFSPPGQDGIQLWIQDGTGASGLTGTVRIHSASTGYSLEQALADDGDGRYSYLWSIAGLPRASDYRTQLTLDDGRGGLQGADAFVKLSGRAVWVWGQAVGDENPAIWTMMTNIDDDGNGVGDRDELLAFADGPDGTLDPYVTTIYLSVYPYLGFSGTTVTDTFQSFLTAAHSGGQLRIEALGGTYEWVENSEKLQEGKNFCDAILNTL